MAETKKPSLKEKVAKAGLTTLGAILEKRKKDKELREKSVQEMIEESDAMVQTRLDRVKMGLPPSLDEQGVPMKSAMSLLGEKVKTDFEGTDVAATSAKMTQDITESLPRDYSGRAQSYLEERKKRIVHGTIARRNPELYPKPGGGGAEETAPSLLKQLARQRQPNRGSSYES